MKSLVSVVMAGLMAAGVSLSARADVACDDSPLLTGNGGYIACLGPLSGNVAAGQTSEVSFEGFGDFVLVGTSDDVGNGPFATIDAGLMSFDTTLYGSFVIGVKGGPGYSLYLFDGGSTGISSLSFDTLGIVKGNGRAGPDLSHLALFVSAVPEPTNAAMLLAGLAMIGVVARRRR